MHGRGSHQDNEHYYSTWSCSYQIFKSSPCSMSIFRSQNRLVVIVFYDFTVSHLRSSHNLSVITFYTVMHDLTHVTVLIFTSLSFLSWTVSLILLTLFSWTLGWKLPSWLNGILLFLFLCDGKRVWGTGIAMRFFVTIFIQIVTIFISNILC